MLGFIWKIPHPPLPLWYFHQKISCGFHRSRVYTISSTLARRQKWPLLANYSHLSPCASGWRLALSHLALSLLLFFINPAPEAGQSRRAWLASSVINKQIICIIAFASVMNGPLCKCRRRRRRWKQFHVDLAPSNNTRAPSCIAGQLVCLSSPQLRALCPVFPRPNWSPNLKDFSPPRRAPPSRSPQNLKLLIIIQTMELPFKFLRTAAQFHCSLIFSIHFTLHKALALEINWKQRACKLQSMQSARLTCCAGCISPSKLQSPSFVFSSFNILHASLKEKDNSS